MILETDKVEEVENLDKIKRKCPDVDFIIINSRVLKFPDQDALNLICHDHILMLPSIYNHCDVFFFRG